MFFVVGEMGPPGVLMAGRVGTDGRLLKVGLGRLFVDVGVG